MAAASFSSYELKVCAPYFVNIFSEVELLYE